MELIHINNIHKKGKTMKKVVLVALALAGVSANSLAADDIEKAKPENTISVGYANSTVEVSGVELFDDAPGFSLKWRRDINESFGFITTFTHTSKSISGNGISLDLDYYSYMVGPTLRANDYFSVYGLVGLAQGEYSGFASADDDAFAYGLGMQVDLTKSVALDASYEKTEFSGDIEVSTWTLGVGYRF